MQNVAPFRVLFFDIWTKGVVNCHRIMNAAPPGEFEFKLLHIASLNHYNEPLYCVLDDLPCYDIKAINPRSLAASIAAFSPHVVVNFNIGSIMDRVLYLTCAKLGIPTIYTDHGAITDSTALRALCKDIDRRLTIWAYIKRVPKFCRIIPWYLDVRRPRPLREGMEVLWKMARTPKQSTHFPEFASELWPTLALAYNNDSANHLSEVVKVPADRIRTVGNPELDVSFQYRQTPPSAEKRRDFCNELGFDPLVPIVFYADEGLARSGIFEWTDEIAIQNLKTIAAACAESGLQLLARPRQGSEQFFDGIDFVRRKCGF